MGPILSTKAKAGLLKQISVSFIYVYVKEMREKITSFPKYWNIKQSDRQC